MRLSLLTLTATAALFVAADAGAQTYDPHYPVCMHVYTGGSGGFGGGGGSYFDCSFTSLPQCRATASGRAATCDINPYYAFNEPPPPPRKRHKKAY